MADEHGIDPHVLSVAVSDPGWSQLERLDDLPTLLRAEIEHFFAIYKDLDPDRHSSVNGWHDREAALREIDQSRQRYRDAA